MKITAGDYLFPIFGLLVIRLGYRSAIVAVALGGVVFSLPFCLAQVSVRNYWFSLNNSAHGIVIEILLRNFQYSILMLVPVLAMLRERHQRNIALSKDQAAYFLLIVTSIIASCFVGANNGSGSYHLIPCVVPLLDCYFWFRRDLPAAGADAPFVKYAAASVLSLLALSSVSVKSFASTLEHARQGERAVLEIRKVEREHPNQTIEVGIGDNFWDFRTFYAALTTMDGQPSEIVGLAVRELQVAGFEIPESTIRYMRSCGTRIWLIPRGAEPFSATNDYFGLHHPAFSESFRATFLAHYRKLESGLVYDHWYCADAI